VQNLIRSLVFYIILLLLTAGCAEDKRPSILLIVIDTLAADHMSCYGYERETTPSIDSLASSGKIWFSMQAQAPWTLPAMTSILTGVTVRTHGCRHYEDASYGLDPELPTLTTILLENGYVTAAFVNINYLGDTFGLSKDFEHFCIDDEGHGRARLTVDSLLAWLDEDNPEMPFFVFFHLFDPHLPYDPPEGFDTAFEPRGTSGITEWRTNALNEWYPSQAPHLMNLYDGEIKWTDSQLGRLFAELRERDLTDNLIIVLTADHGEEFLEHGDWGHGNNLYQNSIHVPLIISGPGIPAGSSDSITVGQVDILPTLLTFAGIPVPQRIEGLDLFGVIPPDRPVFSSGVFSDSTMAALVADHSKIIWSPVDDYSEMFKLRVDPAEMNRLDADSLLLDELLEYWAWPCLWEPTKNELAAIQLKQLRNLGYIN
jgi:arylsulfatase A-like enzyme